MRRVDGWLGLSVFGLTMFGIVMIYSASVIAAHVSFHDDTFFVKRQMVWALLGWTGTAIMANIDYHFWKRWAGWMLGITLLLLMSVFLFPTQEINGAHRWIIVFGQSFQPSELAKLTFIIYSAAWLVERKKQIGDIMQTFLPFVAVLIVISLLMLKQPDFGTLMIILVPAIAIYYAAGLTWKQVLIGIAIVVIAFVPLISVGERAEYRRNRVLTFLNPTHDTEGISYHVQQISIAVGTGGLTGLGFGESRQKRLFLPEPYTDSIFAVITEELGFFWAEVILLVLGFVIYRGYLIAARAPDLFGRLLAVGITSWFAFQAFINLGSMLHVVPLVGVPLPFISYGGTNLLISLIGLGLLLSISRHVVAEEENGGRGRRRIGKRR